MFLTKHEDNKHDLLIDLFCHFMTKFYFYSYHRLEQI